MKYNRDSVSISDSVSDSILDPNIKWIYIVYKENYFKILSKSIFVYLLEYII